MKNSASSPTLKTLKSTMVFCYICGRQYGSKSFAIHIKTCLEKFHNEQQLKTNPKDRLALPECPTLFDAILTGVYDSVTLKNYNDDAYQIYKYKVLPKCNYCQRTFNYESLKVHEKGCAKKAKGSVAYDDYSDNKELTRPKTLLCCVCGRQFGTKSLKIHYPQCLQRFNKDEFMRCVNPKDRRNAPQFTSQQIQLFNSKEDWSHDQIQEFYKMAMARYRNESMMECHNCKRKFIPESLEKHVKNCILINGNRNPQAHLRKVQSQKVLHFYQKNIKKPKTLMCYICGRQFGLTSLQIHQKSCFQKFKIEQQNKPKNERKKLPELPQQIIDGDFNILEADTWQQSKIERYNQIISDLYNKKTLTQCYICERTFIQESLLKHLVHCENNLEKLKFKRNKSCDENQLVKRCESIQKIKRQQKQKSLQKDTLKPRVLMCHICGRQFGTTSLQIHWKTCIQKFKIEQAQKDKQQQKQLPQVPEQLRTEEYNIKFASEWPPQKIQHYNKIVYEVFNKKTLQTCYVCERTFFEESLAKHIKFCEKYALEKIKRSPSLNQNEMKILQKHKEIQKEKQTKQNQYYAMAQMAKPKTLVCHICGRSYGLTSLNIHIPNCIKKFNDIENKKLPQQRKELPSIQSEIKSQQFDISSAQAWPRQKIEIYNEVCTRVYNHKSLTKCQYCSRTFFDEQIKKHQAFCEKQALKNAQKLKEFDQNKKKTSLKKSQSMNCSLTSYRLQKQSQKKIQQPPQPKVLFCHICGRQFGLYSLKIHAPQCKQKFIKQESLKPENKRKKLPELSLTNLKQEKENAEGLEFNIEKAQTWTTQQIKRFNEVCRQIYINESLYKCQHCGRSFQEQQLPKHLKFCQKDPFKKIVKRVHEQESTQISDYQIPMSMAEAKENEEEEMFFAQKKIKFETEVISKDFSGKTVMSIIEQEDVEHQQSTISPSPQNESKARGSRQSSRVTEFSIIPLEISRMSQEKSETGDKKYYMNNQVQKALPKKDTNLNKSLTNLTLKQQGSSVLKGVVKRSSSSNMIDLNASVGQLKQTEKQEKECEHCKKKVKPDLYQRHMQMCKSNASMTGYMRKDTAKLKV